MIDESLRIELKDCKIDYTFEVFTSIICKKLFSSIGYDLVRYFDLKLMYVWDYNVLI